MSKLRVLLVGFGKIAATSSADLKTSAHFEFSTHMSVLEKHPDFVLAGVCDTDENARTRAKRFKVPVYSNVKESLGENYDVIVISTPPDERYETIKNLPPTRAIVCEKPLAQTLQEAEKVVGFCKEKRVLLQVNYWRRADSKMLHLAAGELLENIGEVQTALGYYGNGVKNNGSHLINLIEMQLGPIAEVQWVAKSQDQKSFPIKDDFNCDGIIKMKSGVHVHMVALNFEHFREVALDVWGTKGRLMICHEGLDIAKFKVSEHRALTGSTELNLNEIHWMPTGASRALYDLYTNLSQVLSGQSRGEQIQLFSDGESALSTQRWIDAIQKRI
jgi:predicted dehydrogenase